LGSDHDKLFAGGDPLPEVIFYGFFGKKVKKVNNKIDYWSNGYLLIMGKIRKKWPPKQ